ncbi:response regulator [Streptomyces noursei]
MADDEEVVLDGLARVLDAAPDVQVVGRAASGRQALSLAVVLSPDVLVVDLRMRDMGGLAVARRLRDTGRTLPRVLAVTSYADRALLVDAWAAGVRGVLIKTSAPSDLQYAVQKVAAGGVVLDSVLAADMLDHLAARLRDPIAEEFERRWEQLTEQEKRAMIGASQGLTNLAIAQRLGVAEGTVKSHVSRALGKLRMRNRAHVAAVFNRVRQTHAMAGAHDPGPVSVSAPVCEVRHSFRAT